MNGETVNHISQVTPEERIIACRMSGISEYVDVVLVPHAQDEHVPNYTSPRDVALALTKVECAVPNTLRGVVIKALDPTATMQKIDDSAEALADFMIDDGFDELRADHKFTSLIQLAMGIDDIKIDKHGANTPTDKSNELTYRTVNKLVEFMEQDEESVRIYDAVFNAIDLLASENEYFGWFAAKALTVQSLLTIYRKAQEVAVQELQFNPEANASTEARQAIDELFDHVMEVRTYGVKQAYTSSRRGGSFIYEDPSVLGVTDIDNNGNNRISKGSLAAVAVVVVTPQTSFDNLEVKVKEESYGKRGKLFAAGFNIDSIDATLVLGADGELYNDHLCSQSVREIFEIQGAGGAYEALRAEIVANFVDLVMPAELVRSSGLHHAHREYGVPVDEVIYSLILPRKNYMKGLTEEAITKEDENEVDGSTRIIREHGVVYHTRKLLPNQKASPQAIALAERHNMPLPEGRTFVRAHQRGSGPKVVGHNFKGNA